MKFRLDEAACAARILLGEIGTMIFTKIGPPRRNRQRAATLTIGRCAGIYANAAGLYDAIAQVLGCTALTIELIK